MYLLATIVMASPWTLDDVVATALRRAPDLDVALQRLEVSRRQVDVAAMWQNPQLSTGTNWRSGHLYTTVVIPMPLFGQRGAAVSAAQANERELGNAYEAARNEVRLRSRLAWLDVWQAEQELDALRQTLARRTQILEMSRVKEDAGTGSGLESLRGRVELMRAQTELRVSEARLRQSAANLCFWLAESEPCAGVIGTKGEPPAAPMAPSNWADMLAWHPAARQAEASRDAAMAEVLLEERLRWPTVGLELGVALFSPTAPRSDAHVGLSFELPVLQLHGPLVARAQSAARQVDAEAHAVFSRLRSGAAATVQAMEAVRQRVITTVSDMVPTAAAAASLAKDGYRDGAFDINSVLLAEQALSDAYLEAARARAEAGRAWAILHSALGDE